jgi:Protein of unknown function (DUF3375)
MFCRDTTPSDAGDVVGVPYVGASGRTTKQVRGAQVGDNGGLSAPELLELNRDLVGSRAVRLLATTNLGLYATLMERHLSDGAVPETELVVCLERDLDELAQADGPSGLALIKSWASQGWLHRIVDVRAGQEQNVIRARRQPAGLFSSGPPATT